MTRTPCASCGGANPDGAYLCEPCTVAYEYDLAAVEPTLNTVADTISRQSVTGDSVGSSGSKNPPPPIDLDAAETQWALQQHLLDTALAILAEHTTTWQGDCAKLATAWVTASRDNPKTPLPVYPTRPSLPSREPGDLAALLLNHRERIRHRTWAPEAKARLARLLKACEQAAERLEPRIFAGTCSTVIEDVTCGAELYARAGDYEARCKVCGATYEVQAWRAHGRTAAQYAILNPQQLSRALGGYGLDITPHRIRQWASRGKLDRANPEHDEHGCPVPALYRLGDALDTYQHVQQTKHLKETAHV